jgi:hypothetical protein
MYPCQQKINRRKQLYELKDIKLEQNWPSALHEILRLYALDLRTFISEYKTRAKYCKTTDRDRLSLSLLNDTVSTAQLSKYIAE